MEQEQVELNAHSRMLNLGDIADLRAYERDRESYRRQVIELKRRRRVAVGSIVSLVFENRETMRSQIQEMARAEKMVSDEQIQKELDVYNALIPEPGELSATLFIELTGEDAMRDWLPRLVGIEHAVLLRLPAGAVVRAVPEAAHEEALTRPDITASVHYIRFAFGPDQVERFATGPVTLAVDHPEYRAESLLSEIVRAELLTDLRP
ncbi:MAG TPA: DUF3501 family protein [Acidimicrobiales bacterium]